MIGPGLKFFELDHVLGLSRLARGGLLPEQNVLRILTADRVAEAEASQTVVVRRGGLNGKLLERRNAGVAGQFEFELRGPVG